MMINNGIRYEYNERKRMVVGQKQHWCVCVCVCVCQIEERKEGSITEEETETETDRERWRDKNGDRVIKAGRELAVNKQS